MNNEVKIDDGLYEYYNSQYNSEDEKWRMLGAHQKATNIINISEHLNLKNCVDIGSGDGSVLFWLDKKSYCNNITSVEISDSGITAIKEKQIKSIRDLQKFDGYKTDFNDKQFDIALCSHVIEHVEHPRLLLNEIKRISKMQIFEVPIDFSFKVDRKIDHFLSYGHINIYTPQTFCFLLKSTGFEIVDSKNEFYSYATIKHLLADKKISFKYLFILKRWMRKLLISTLKPDTITVLTK